MDRSEKAPSSEPARRSPKGEGGSQSKLPSVLLWIFLAAALFRIVTAVTDRQKLDAGAGLVRWRPRQTAVSAARLQGKAILYNFTAAWCPPCHRLDSEGWGNPNIAGMVNQWYLPARVVDRQREDGKNPPGIDELQWRYAINAFPTLIVADASGREIARSEGYAGREILTQFLDESWRKAKPGAAP